MSAQAATRAGVVRGQETSAQAATRAGVVRGQETSAQTATRACVVRGQEMSAQTTLTRGEAHRTPYPGIRPGQFVSIPVTAGVVRAMTARLAIAFLIALAGAASSQAVQAKDEILPLAAVKRIYVDQLGGGGQSDQLRDMIIAALQNSGLFIITENPDRADATLRGSADDKTFMENHSTQESLGLHASTGQGESSSEGGIGRTSQSKHSTLGSGLSDSESSHIEERRHEADASVRLVDQNGDVIWSTTQESGGGKFRGASADVADKVAHNLVEAVERARAAFVPKPPAPAAKP